MAEEPSKKADHKWVYELIYHRGDLARRLTQDSPVLPDVWEAYAGHDDELVDLLLTPYQDPETGGTSAGELCRELYKRLGEGNTEDRDIAYNQSNVAVKLKFAELVRDILPMSRWWQKSVCADDRDGSGPGAGPAKGKAARRPKGPPGTGAKGEAKPDALARLSKGLGIHGLVEALFDPDKKVGAVGANDTGKPVIKPEVLWMVRVIGTIALVNQRGESAAAEFLKIPEQKDGEEGKRRRALITEIVKVAAELLEGVEADKTDGPFVYTVSKNREAESSIYKSSVAVKADAVARLFNVDSSHLTWAVIDSGIDAEHYAFRKRPKPEEDADGRPAAKGKARKAGAARSAPRESYAKEAFLDEDGRAKNQTRVVATYDFTTIRLLLRMTPPGKEHDRLPDALRNRLQETPGETEERRTRREKLKKDLDHLKGDIREGREIDWDLVKSLIEVPHREGEYEKPKLDHGTHVAGILAADWRMDAPAASRPDREIRGICPSLNLYDLRVFRDKSDAASAEFTIMSALQFVRGMNAHKKFMVVHGVNLSLSIRHEVENYACGRTPICDECERLVNSGLVVVAAAGNNGYQKRAAESSLDDRYQSMTITDPGNADAVITVGATHRDMPHTYGVSYFSSRGPTGDGRPKPDLVAPGEKIESTIPNDHTASKDGTSMAAPHVSGAAALIMARNTELIGQPARIKQILCDSATDLGRDRYFQGRGMLDILRALQSV
jgi:serine protease AprX